MSAFSCKVFARGSALDWNLAQSSIAITVHGFQESMFWNLFPKQRCFQAVTVRCSCCELLHPWAHTRFPPSEHPLNPLTHSLVAPFILFFYVCLQPQTECTDAHPKKQHLGRNMRVMCSVLPCSGSSVVSGYGCIQASCSDWVLSIYRALFAMVHYYSRLSGKTRASMIVCSFGKIQLSCAQQTRTSDW